MKNLILSLVFCSLFAASLAVGAVERVFLAGCGSGTIFHCAHRLSDGTLLIGGGTDDPGWLPKGTDMAEIGGAAPDVLPGDRTAILIHLSSDLGEILSVRHFPKGFAGEIRTMRTTEVPGETTGALHVEGTVRVTAETSRDGKAGEGYFIARLDGNFLTKPPSGAVWCIALPAKGALAKAAPWDVGPDGRVVFAQGESYGHDWLSVNAVDAAGNPAVVPGWPRHWHAGGEFEGSAADSPQPPTYSGIVLKIAGRGDFRSYSKENYELESSDGNGGIKKGKWPFDAMFDGYFDRQTRKTLAVIDTGKGYYGYRWGGNACAHLGTIAIDRRSGDMYLGGNNKSKLPDGLPDFEPWVVAMDRDGNLKWWQRLYPESKGVSTPDQYVDAIAVDYSRPLERGGAIVVLARAHGNNVNNFWQGDKILHPENPKSSYQMRFTGAQGNIHYQWIGRMTADEGAMLHATYAAEFQEGAKFDTRSKMKNPLLDHWPDINAGWPDLNTTRLRPHIGFDSKGRILVAGTGRNTVTTKNAYQPFPSPFDPDRGVGSWSDFVRAYRPDFSTVDYSTLLSGAWDRSTGKGGGNVTVQGFCAMPGGVLAVGEIKEDGAELPTVNPPAWGAGKRTGSGAVVALLEVP
jgi:hypothetical protein